jgi:hypothetical protein
MLIATAQTEVFVGRLGSREYPAACAGYFPSVTSAAIHSPFSSAIMLACRGVAPTPGFAGVSEQSVSLTGLNFYIRLKFYRALIYVDELTPANHAAQLTQTV